MFRGFAKQKSDRWVNNRVLAETTQKRKGLNPVGKKTVFWQFVGAVLTKFFLKIELDKICEQCQGTSYCGPLTPAHTRRRQDIARLDWWYAFRVAVLGSECHRSIDELGRRAAEPILENIIRTRFKKMELKESDVKRLLIRCAQEVQAEQLARYGERAKWQEYVVEFPEPEAPFEIDDSIFTDG